MTSAPTDDFDVLAKEIAAHLAGAPALQLDGAPGRLGSALSLEGVELVTVSGDWPAVQLDRRFGVVVVTADGPAEHRRAVLHCAVQHTAPGGRVVVWWDDDAPRLLAEFELEQLQRCEADGGVVTVARRTARYTVHDLVFEARASIRRVHPGELAERLASAAAPLVLDTRTHTDRVRFGVIPGSVHVPRTVIEWHLDPANGYRHPAVTSFDQPLVVVCNGGYSSSIAAHTLQRLGFTDVADLIGGHHAWVASGLPVVEPDHSHLDL